MNIHGGPWGHTTDSWWSAIFLQNLSQQGYNVLDPNYRGSDGFGKEFQNLDVGDPGGGDLEDVVFGVNWLKEQKEVIPNNIGIMGASYGGYMTLMALTKKPDLFIFMGKRLILALMRLQRLICFFTVLTAPTSNEATRLLIQSF